jgi:hypothetical protein
MERLASRSFHDEGEFLGFHDQSQFLRNLAARGLGQRFPGLLAAAGQDVPFVAAIPDAGW